MNIRDTSPPVYQNPGDQNPGDQNPDDPKSSNYKYPENYEIKSLQAKQNNPPKINDGSAQSYRKNSATRDQASDYKSSINGTENSTGKNPRNNPRDNPRDNIGKNENQRPANNRPVKQSASNSAVKPDNETDTGLSQVQQQFVLRFCRQLASVIAACEQSESAEIEVGRRQINASQVKVKLQAEREYTDKTN